MYRIDETGNVYGRWTVERYAGNRHWICICRCGTKKSLDARELRKGSTNSCGCLRREYWSKRFTTHGGTGTSLYNVWRSMIKRCNVPTHKSYSRYGGRGIRVLWESFESFKKDMEEGYGSGLSIERIDNDGDYCKENCRWATFKEQARNRNRSIYLEHDGKVLTLPEWSEITGIGYATLFWRFKHWGGVERVINQKIKKTK